MRRLSVLFSLTLALLTCAATTKIRKSQAGHDLRRHSGHHVKVPDGTQPLGKRFSTTRWTFFDVGVGTCGKVNVASDFVVALDAVQFGNGEHCFETITMSYNGKTTQAKIVDKCPSCSFGALDLSRGLFDFFAAESVGVIFGEWNFGGANAGTTTRPPAPQHNSVSTQPTSKSSSSTLKQATVTTSLPSPSSSPTTVSDGNLADLSTILITFGELAVAGAARP